MKFKSNIEVQAGIEDKDGQVGSNGQILASTGSQVDWIDPANIVTSATDVIIECKNTSGVTIAKGTPVYQTGNVGATAVIEVAVADASDEDKMAAIGLLQSDLINNAFGYVVVTGELLNITTSPIDGSTPTVGDTIYVKPGGGLTLTKPTGVNFIQNVGLVGKVSGGNAGSLTVSSIMRSNDVPTPLYIDHDNQRLGVGATSPSQKLDVSGIIAVNGVKFLSTIGSESYIWNNTGGLSVVDDTGNTVQLRIKDNGNVAIGTTNPSEKLVVDGKIRSLGGTSSADFYSTGNDALIVNNGTQNLKFWNNGSERMRIKGDGNVGIGTTSPTAKLHITKDNTTGNALLITNSGSSRSLEINHNADGAGVSDEVVRIMNNGTRLFTIESDGNVGIGTASPGAKLEVRNNDDSQTDTLLYIAQNPVTTEASVRTAWLRGESSAEAVRIDNYGSGHALIVGEGNVGIGTTSPSTKLHIVEPSSTTPPLSIQNSNANGYSGSWFYDSAGTVVGHLGWANGTTTALSNKMYFGTIANKDVVFTTNDTERMRIDSTGNVGIGTTSPQADFVVSHQGTSGIEIEANFQMGVNNILSFDRTAGALAYETMRLAAGDFWFTVLGVERMRINSVGNVGIGTASPERLLSLYSNNAETTPRLLIEQDGTGDAVMAFSLTDGQGWSMGIDNSGSDSFMIHNSAGGVDSSSQFTINTGGNVGIGTTSPSTRLEVSSSGANGILISKDPNSTSNSGRLFFETDTVSEGFSFLNSNGLMTIRSQAQAGSTSGNVRVAIDSSGNVGIGVTAPVAKLDVLGTSSGPVVFDYAYATNAGLRIHGDESAMDIVGTDAGNHASTILLRNGNEGFGLLNNPTLNTLQFRSFTATADGFSIHSAGSNLSSLVDIVTLEKDGNVGIGTTSPSSKLQVAGGIQMADDTATASADKVGTMRYRTGTEYVEVDGVELVTNGDFATDTDWNKGANTTISGGTLNSTAIGVYVIANQSGVVSQSLYYKWTVTYTITSGGIRLGDSNNVWAGSDQTASGTYTGFVQAASTADGNLYMTSPSSDFIGSVDNVSVIEVTEEDASYADMCMQTGASTYEWVNIVRNTY